MSPGVPPICCSPWRSTSGFPRRPRHAEEVVGHQDADEHHQHDGEGGTPTTARTAEDVLLDEFSDHVRLGRPREKRGRVVVAEHRQHNYYAPREDALRGKGQGHAEERPRRASPEVARRLDHPRVDAVERGEEGQDQERHVTVDETQDNGGVLADQPLPRRIEDAHEHEDLVDVAVRGEKVHPREHPHEVVDPEWRDDEHQERHAPASGVPGDVVGDRVPDQEAKKRGDRDVDERTHEDDAKLAAEELAKDRPELCKIPRQRVPRWQRATEDGVRRSHGHGENRVERDEEKQDQPYDARSRQRGPQPALLAYRTTPSFVGLAHAASLPAGLWTTSRASDLPPPGSAAW